MALQPRHPIAAADLGRTMAAFLVEVESDCERDGCAPDCEVAVAARKLAVVAAALERDMAEERWDQPALRVL